MIKLFTIPFLTLLILIVALSSCSTFEGDVWTVHIKSWSIVDQIPNVWERPPAPPYTWLRLSITIKNNSPVTQIIEWYDNDLFEYITNPPNPYGINCGLFYTSLDTRFRAYQSQSAYLYIRIPYDDDLNGTIKISMKYGPVEYYLKLSDVSHIQ